MLPLTDYPWLKDYHLNKLPAILAEAEQRRLLAEAGLRPRPWLACQACRSLWRLGRLLVAAGQRLEQRYAPLALKPA